MCPTLSTGRGLFFTAVLIVVVGYAIILWHRWYMTRIDWLSAIVAIGGLAYSFRLIPTERLTTETAAGRDELLSQVVAVFVLLLAFYAFSGLRHQSLQAHVRQAVAFVHGHTYVDAPN
jgi:hypothetical protein